MYADYRLRHHQRTMKDMINDHDWNANTFPCPPWQAWRRHHRRRAACRRLPALPTPPSTTSATWALGSNGEWPPWACLRTANTAFPGRPCSVFPSHQQRRVQDRRRPGNRCVQPGCINKTLAELQRRIRRRRSTCRDALRLAGHRALMPSHRSHRKKSRFAVASRFLRHHEPEWPNGPHEGRRVESTRLHPPSPCPFDTVPPHPAGSTGVESRADERRGWQDADRHGV